MKIVILGNGRFGSYLANRLDEAGQNVIVIDRSDTRQTLVQLMFQEEGCETSHR